METKDLLFDLVDLLVMPVLSEFPFAVVVNIQDELLAVDEVIHSRFLVGAFPEVFNFAAVDLTYFPMIHIRQVLNGRAVDQNFVLVVAPVIAQAHEPVVLEVVEDDWVRDQAIQFPISQPYSDTFKENQLTS